MKDKQKFVYVSIAVPWDLWDWLKVYAQERGLKPTQALRVLLSDRRLAEAVEQGRKPVSP